MAELQPDEKIERKNLAFMRVATQHQVDLALRPFPYRRLVDEGKIEGALARQLFDSSCSRRYWLLVDVLRLEYFFSVRAWTASLTIDDSVVELLLRRLSTRLDREHLVLALTVQKLVIAESL